MRSASWYLQRLRAMSAAEILARCRDTASQGLQRAGFLLALDPPAAEDPSRSVHWIGEPPRDGGERYVAASERIAAGRWRIFDREFATDPRGFDWNRDPLTGVQASDAFGPSIDLHDRGAVGDIKYLWEPNRHLLLVSCAQAYAASGDERHLTLLRTLLESWLARCRYPQGPNWSSGLELAIRLINWSLCWQMIGGASSAAFRGEDGRAFRDAWLRSVYQHVHFVRGHYSRFSSANNHLMGEAAGVFVAGCTWPLWPAVRRWGEEAFAILQREVEAQVAPDGVDREQTLSYQRFVLEFLVLCRLAGRGAGCRFPQAFDARLLAMIDFLESLTDVGGNLPMIGDADDGSVVQLSHEPSFDGVRYLAAAGRIAVGRPMGVTLGTVEAEVVRWLTGAPERGGLEPAGVVGQPVPRTSFPEGGYYLLGRDLGLPAEVRMLVDAGPLGYLSIAAHGHADALAVWLSVAGREFLVDPGTYLYHGAPQWRAWFRGTSAHNTLSVDGLDQSEQAGSFLWARHASARCVMFEESVDRGVFVGEHDGYRRLTDPVVHRREIRRSGATFEITDILEAREGHDVDQWWHFAESCEVALEGRVVVARSGHAAIRMTLAEGFSEITALRGSESPPGGWISRRYGARVASTTLRCRARAQGTVRFVTLLECFQEGIRP